MTEIKPIRSAKDYEIALKAVDELWGAASDTPEGDRLDILATLIDAYEREVFPIDQPREDAVARFQEEQREALNEQVAPRLIFQISEDQAGGFFFRTMRADEIIFRSEAFVSKSDAIDAVKLLQKDAGRSEIVDVAA